MVMKSINVLIAVMSQLVRIGIIGIIKKLDFPFLIHDISQTKKKISSLQKDSKNLLIISSSYVNNLSTELIPVLFSEHKKSLRVLVRDEKLLAKVLPDFDDIIESTDNEKIIARKFKRILSSLSKIHSDINQSDEISEREKDVLQLVAMGMTNKEIAEKLFISAHTVITHRKNITAKLGIKTIAGLTVYAVIHKLIIPEEIQ
jgi:DNA-binding CsgD family transcriptional regulator